MSEEISYSLGWSPLSWKNFPIKQQPQYDDPAALDRALKKVQALPPIVHKQEVEALKACLAKACEGKMFLIQGGDCAERFDDCTQEAIEKKFKIMLQMSLIIIYGARMPVVRVARMAGQFAKPRSAPFEEVDGAKVHSYKGDSINGYQASERTPDPERLVSAYFHSVATINFLRAMISDPKFSIGFDSNSEKEEEVIDDEECGEGVSGKRLPQQLRVKVTEAKEPLVLTFKKSGVSDLHMAKDWKLENVLSAKTREEYEGMVQKILDALSFLSTIEAFSEATRSVHLYSSHEGLLLDYEAALTQQDPQNRDYYNLGSHFLWIGDRTRQLDGAHVEYFRGISNPIGLKVGPSMEPDELARAIRILNPDAIPGRLTLITRYGCDTIATALPAHIRAAQSTNIPVLWVSDPCHGNTEVTAEGIKTRIFEKMVSEMVQAFQIHAENGSHLGGVHLELTGEDVTECLGGSCEFTNLSTKYESFCDPRLNYTQSLDFAFAIAKQLNTRRC